MYCWFMEARRANYGLILSCKTFQLQAAAKLAQIRIAYHRSGGSYDLLDSRRKLFVLSFSKFIFNVRVQPYGYDKPTYFLLALYWCPINWPLFLFPISALSHHLYCIVMVRAFGLPTLLIPQVICWWMKPGRRNAKYVQVSLLIFMLIHWLANKCKVE